MKNLRLFNIALLLVAVLLVPVSHARVDSLVSISLADDTQLEGTIIQETEAHVLVETLSRPRSKGAESFHRRHGKAPCWCLLPS